MNTLRTILLMSFFYFCATLSIIGAAEPKADTESPQEKVTLKWLGTAGWELQLGSTKLLIDPFLTRREPSANAEWKTDEEAVLKVINGAEYIFAEHSHADHIGDIPFITKQSKMISSRTTTNIALTAEMDKSQLITIQNGE